MTDWQNAVNFDLRFCGDFPASTWPTPLISPSTDRQAIAENVDGLP